MRSTALTQFQRLEAAGSWRPAPGEKLREVIVSIGEATLILSDPKSDAPLTHWSLPAVERLNPSRRPAIFTPAAADQERMETLEIDDPLMIEAIDRVQGVIAARRPHPGRLRSRLMMAALLAMVIGSIVWLPAALRSHAARITPQAERARIGETVLADMIRATGQPCSDPASAPVLAALAARIPLPAKSRIAVLPQGEGGAIMLPGNLMVVDNALISGEAGPEALAGHMLAASLSASRTDPLAQIVQRAGFLDVLGLLTQGTLSSDELHGYGSELLATPPAPPDDPSLLAGFTQAKIPSTPYAESRGTAAAVALSEGDPFRTEPYPAILSERDWVTLQQICVERG